MHRLILVETFYFSSDCVLTSLSQFLELIIAERVIASETEFLSADNDVYVFGEPLDQPIAFGQRGATFEQKMIFPIGHREQLSKGPAYPEVFLNNGR